MNDTLLAEITQRIVAVSDPQQINFDLARHMRKSCGKKFVHLFVAGRRTA